MKLITKIEAQLDLKSILATTTATITRHFTLFVGADNKDLPRILQAARDARDLLKNDADMTIRLIAVRPERSEDYKAAWATAAEKQLLNIYGLIKEAFENEKLPDGSPRELRFEPSGELVTPEEIHDWKTPAPVQQEHPGAPLILDELPPRTPAPTPQVEPEPEPEGVLIP